MSWVRKVTSKLQVTLPRQVAKAIGVKEGEEIIFALEGKTARILAVPKDPLQALKSISAGVKMRDLRAEIRKDRKSW